MSAQTALGLALLANMITLIVFWLYIRSVKAEFHRCLLMLIETDESTLRVVAAIVAKMKSWSDS